MPLFEYVCRTCAHQFELLVRTSDVPACPACHGTALERKLSVFAAHRGLTPAPHTGIRPRDAARAAAPGPCGACGDPRGPGACSIN